MGYESGTEISKKNSTFDVFLRENRMPSTDQNGQAREHYEYQNLKVHTLEFQITIKLGKY